MSRIDIIAEVLVQEIETLKTTVKEVKELQQKGVEINQKPLNDFMIQFNKSTEKIENLNYIVKRQQNFLLIMFVIIIILAGIAGGWIYESII